MDFKGIIEGNSLVSYFLWGFIASSFATAFVWINETQINGKTPTYADTHSLKRMVRMIYETLVTGTMGGLLAIAVNHNIAIAILTGFLAQSIFIALFKWTKETGFKVIVSEMFGNFIRSTSRGIIDENNKKSRKR